MEPKISAIMVIYNEENLIERALRSIKDVVDEILILHDGPCTDNSLEICRKYTKNIFQTEKRTGVPGPILPILFREVRYPWILKIDADEFLSDELKKNIKFLVQDKSVSAYTFIWPYWNGKKYITKKWPRKSALYQKSKMHYFGFPHWDDPMIDGKIVDTNFILEHHPISGSLPKWSQFKKKILGRYAFLQASYTLKNFESFDNFQWNNTDFPVHIKLRKSFPLLSIPILTFAAFVKTLFKGGAWREGYPALHEATQALIYYPYLGYLTYKLKKGRKNEAEFGLWD